MALNSCGDKTASSSGIRGEIAGTAIPLARLNYRAMSKAEQILLRIQRRLTAVNLSERAASKQARKSPDLIRSIRREVAEGKRQGVSSTTIEALAPVLRTTPQWLLTGEGTEDTGDEAIAPEEAANQAAEFAGVMPSNVVIAGNIEAPRTWTYPNDLPVFGTAAGSVIHRVEGTQIERDIVDFVRRPPALMGNREAYAVYVAGDSMHPLHKRGELKLVDPRSKPAIEDSVVVTTRHNDQDPGQAYIKILKRRTPGFLVLEQLNPPAVLQIPMQFVESVHKVLTIDDLFGV